MTIYVTPHGKATACRYRARMAVEFEAMSVSLPMPPRHWTPPSPAAPAVPVPAGWM